jgi:hypothetical protein
MNTNFFRRDEVEKEPRNERTAELQEDKNYMMSDLYY